MNFLDHFDDEQRRRFEAAAVVIQLERGSYLLRRGEPGGDIFLLRNGKLDVVDSHTTPEVTLSTLLPGAVVGEMAFVDDSPRSADVRATIDSEILQWPAHDLRALLNRDSVLAAAFFEALARIAADRVRTLTNTAMVGALNRAKATTAAGLARVRDETRIVAELAKESLRETEMKLRQDPTDDYAKRKLQELLDRLQSDVGTLFLGFTETDAQEEAAKMLGRELHPYLVRSSLAERCIRRPHGQTATAEVMSHILVDTPGGDGQLGELIDRWLLDRPTLKAFRAIQGPLIDLVGNCLPTHRNRRVLLVNAGTGSLVAGLMEVLPPTPTVLTVLDQSRDALAFLDSGIAAEAGVDLVAVQESPAQFALGRGRRNLMQQDVVILHGLLEYLPDRIAVSLLRVSADLLAPGGTVVSSALAPSPDQSLFDHVLNWPTIRRTQAALYRVFQAAKADIVAEPVLPSPALLFQTRPRSHGAVAAGEGRSVAERRPSQ